MSTSPRDVSPRASRPPEAALPQAIPDNTAADTLIAELEQGGAVSDAGEFTLSPDAARLKMRQHQLAAPHHYVLLLVQAAVLRSARRISFEFDADDMRLVFDGQGLTREELDGVHGAFFSRRSSHPSLQELAIALTAAEALSPLFVQVRSTVGAETFELELSPGLAQVVRPAKPLDWPTRVQVRMPLGQTVHGAIREVLLARCRFATTEIFLDRSRISRGMKLPGKLPQVPIVGPDLRGVASWEPEGPPGRGMLRLVKSGVWFTTLYPPFTPWGAHIVIEGDHLRKTLSQDTVVQDDVLAAVLDAARAAGEAALSALRQVPRSDDDSLTPQTRAQAQLLLRRIDGVPRR